MPQTVFEAASQDLLARHPADEAGRMLQSPGLRTSGKFYGFAPGDDLVVKLPADRVAALIDAGDGLPCSPRPGAPMREWVRIPTPDESTAVSFLLEARAFVAAATAR
jgi:hypothetical protein